MEMLFLIFLVLGVPVGAPRLLEALLGLSAVRTSRMLAMIPTGLGIVFLVFCFPAEDDRTKFLLLVMGLALELLAAIYWVASFYFAGLERRRVPPDGPGLSPSPSE